MINIRPVSDLRNKYPEIEKIVLNKNEDVYLTKNGYGSMVVMSIEKYYNLMKQANLDKALEVKFNDTNIEKVIEEMDEEIANDKSDLLSHEEVFTKLRRKLDEK